MSLISCADKLRFQMATSSMEPLKSLRSVLSNVEYTPPTANDELKLMMPVPRLLYVTGTSTPSTNNEAVFELESPKYATCCHCDVFRNTLLLVILNLLVFGVFSKYTVNVPSAL